MDILLMLFSLFSEAIRTVTGMADDFWQWSRPHALRALSGIHWVHAVLAVAQLGVIAAYGPAKPWLAFLAILGLVTFCESTH